MAEADPLVMALRRAGCVYAEQEARILRESAVGIDELHALSARRIAGEPLEHLVGWVEFAGRRLAVGPGVFVSRRRSELLAAVTIALAVEQPGPVIVEAFCGIAPIAATTLAWVPSARVVATDIDGTALHYARANLGESGATYRGTGLTGLPRGCEGAVTVVAAVAPYVPDAALHLLPHESADHEPRRALSGGADGLDHIRALLAAAPRWLADGGAVAMEMNVAQTPIVRASMPGARAGVFHGRDGQTDVLVLTP